MRRGPTTYELVALVVVFIVVWSRESSQRAVNYLYQPYPRRQSIYLHGIDLLLGNYICSTTYSLEFGGAYICTKLIFCDFPNFETYICSRKSRNNSLITSCTPAFNSNWHCSRWLGIVKSSRAGTSMSW